MAEDKKIRKAPKCLICGTEDPNRFTFVATKSMCMDCRNAYKRIQRGSGDAGREEDRRVYAYYRKMGREIRELAEDPKLAEAKEKLEEAKERNRMATEKLEEAERLRADFDERFKVMEIGLRALADLKERVGALEAAKTEAGEVVASHAVSLNSCIDAFEGLRERIEALEKAKRRG